jgi:ABC-type transport system substrate-binding protein
MAGYRGAIWAGSQIYNGLVETDRNGTIVPCLATSWTVDPSGTAWTFALRTDVWFHDDTCFGPSHTRRFTAHDVQYTFERLCDASTKTTGLWVFRTKIDGAADYHDASKTGRSGRIRGIRVINDSTIRITLTKPFAPFLALLTIPYAWIVPREAIHTYGSEFARHPVGTGPFAFESWKQDVELRLRRNPRYFKADSVGRRLPYLETVAVTFLRDRKNEFLEFIRGNYDMVTSIDNVIAATIFTSNGTLRAPYDTLRAYRAAAQSVEYYGILLDTAFPAARQMPLASSRLLRQALNYAIDRHRIVTYLLGGRGIPASYGVLPPTMPGFSDSVRGYTYDPDRARDLLASAGYPNGKGLPELTLQLGNSDKTAAVAEAVQQMWREVGIRVNLRMIDFPQHLAQVRAGELHLWRTSWLGDYPDPENFLALFVSSYRSPNGPNTTRITRADLDSLYAAALNPARSPADRAALYHRMEQIVLDEAPWVFLYHDVNIRLTLPSVQGFSLDGSDRLLLEYVFKQPVGLLSRNQRSAF